MGLQEKGAQQNLEKLRELDRQAEQGGGDKRIDRQHESGKLTARERLELLTDPGTFFELDKFVTHRSTDFGMEKQKFLGDGVVTGHGQIHGRKVFAVNAIAPTELFSVVDGERRYDEVLLDLKRHIWSLL